MAILPQSIRFTFRSLARQPGFLAVTLLTLSLGIGAATAIFAIVEAVLLRPLPYREPGRVVMVWSHWVNWKKTWLSEPELADYRSMPRSLEDVSGYTDTDHNLTGAGDSIRVRTIQAQASLFEALGVRPLLGRAFTRDEDRPGQPCVVMIGEGLWRSRFGADRAVIGRSIHLDGVACEIVGVVPSAVRLPTDYAIRTPAALWQPLALGRPDENERGNHGLMALARLRPNVTLAQAQAEMDRITRGFFTTWPGAYDPEFGVTLVPAAAEVFGDIRPALLLLLLAVGAVLLVACANVTNLLLARSESRQRELAIRAAIGASRGRIARQLLGEALVLSGSGALGGLGVAVALMRLLVRLDPLKIPRVAELGLDPRVLAFAALATTAATVLVGALPALRAGRISLQPSLKEGARSSARGRTRQALVVVELAASVALVASALLLARSFARVLAVNAGFDPAHALTLRTSLPPASYPAGTSVAHAYAEIGRRLRETPGVVAAGGVTGLPLATIRGDFGFRIEGAPPERKMAADWQVVTPGYFEAIGTPVREGRAFTDRDDAGALPVIIVNETMARTYLGGRDPIGRRLMIGPNRGWLTIVGVVADVHHRGLDAPPRPELYRPHRQFRFGGPDGTAIPSLTWVIRTAGDPIGAAGSARAAIQSVDPGLGVSEVATLDQVVSDSTSDRRLDVLLFALLAGLASALAAIGVYGVMAYAVSQRTHEIGVRMAIGASRREVLGMVVAEGARLAGAGVAIGLVLALTSARLLRGLLFRVSPDDPGTLALAAASLMLVALAASYIPARRAAVVSPLEAIRAD